MLLACSLYIERGSNRSCLQLVCIYSVSLHMRLQCLGYRIGNRLYAVHTEANGARTANSLQMLH
ncbi:hypothetical protein D1872_326270 [compost metagenome]